MTPDRTHRRRGRSHPEAAPTTAVLLALALSFGSAHASTYYIRSDGSDASSGRANTTAGAWRTMSKANSVLVAGDTVFVDSFNPADTSSTSANAINPSANGTDYGNGQIVIRSLHPELVQSLPPVPKATLGKNYIKISGFRIRPVPPDSSSVSGFASCKGSIIDSCYVFSGNFFFDTATHSKLSNSRVIVPGVSSADGSMGFVAWGFDVNSATLSTPRCVSDTIINCDVTQRNLGNTCGRGFMITHMSSDCRIQNNVFHEWWNITGYWNQPQFGSENYGQFFRESFRDTFESNTWIHEAEARASGVADGLNFLVFRSGCRWHYLHNETYLIGLNHAGSGTWTWGARLGQDSGWNPSWQVFYGEPGYSAQAQTGHNIWDGCTWKIANGFIQWQQYTRGSKFLNNVVAVQNTGGERRSLFINSYSNTVKMDSLTFSHNTIYGPGAMGLTQNAGTPAGQVWIGKSLLQNNLFVGGSSGTCSGFPSDGSNGPTSLAIPDTTGSNIGYNLVYSSTGTDSARSIRYDFGGSSSCSGPRGTMRWGDPLFTSTNWSTLDLHPLSGSAAVGAQWPDGYVGAFRPSGPDVTPPSTVTNLAASQVYDKEIVLTWTAPGGDGTIGTAAAYDLRWSNQPITSANFNTATAVSVPPVPAYSGTAQSYVMLNLTAGTAYYFAIKARDASNNWSNVSNVPAATTTATDQAAPSAVKDLGGGP
jgi:hypothetical protein